ncbi:uncharacterized protein LOC107667502 isoform X1 [Sinocyclocheilus anshuiensis]|uniref:uncharacterized protein LOC107667502 isoform X1 n=2 Tax=Sinocyclocheilus anshuiensis TaxID=1608454 RepID=UPI0007B9487F|nr:PREDICTED: uncharacterized protein LOC107667502 isoform X1 [Sinocyclocheilus anshuiensis]
MNMVNAFILLCVCLWRLVDVTDEVKTISVMEGDPVTLHTDANKIQTYLLIQWMFGNTRIAEVGKLTQTNSTYDGPDGRFRGRLQLDQTGSLTITNTRTTDSGLYQVTVFSRETSYMSFSVMVSETPQSSTTPESSTSSSFVSSNLIVNQTEYVNITELHQPSSDHVHCCGFTETVMRLAISALVSVAAVAFLVYDIRSTRNELNRTEETRRHHPTHRVKSDQHQLSSTISSRYVC